MNISIAPELSAKCPELALGCFQAKVKVVPSREELLQYIGETEKNISAKLAIEDINKIKAVHFTREAYKTLGKKPARYRPSAEALLRRVVTGKGLYRVNNVVDLLNLTSISTGFSIGGYDMARIEGDAILGIGRQGEPFDAIARGALNIARLPLFRDLKGPFGSPTSDSTRTMITENTEDFLMVIFNFAGLEGLERLLESVKQDYQKHCGVEEAACWIVQAG